MKFNERLKFLINRKGCTQLELAKFVGVKPNTVSDWIKKGTSPKIEHIYKIAEFFKISFDELFIGRVASESFSNDELDLITLFRNLPQKEQFRELGRLEILAGEYKQEKNVI